MHPLSLALGCALVLSPLSRAQAPGLQRIVVANDGRSFVMESSRKPFVPWGFNYDHDDQGRLLEDYWEAEWDKVEGDFREMKELGANVVRIHLQVSKFLDGPKTPNERSLQQLAKLLALAEKTGLYLDITGLGCYHKQDVPAWYDALSESQRWDAQAVFWEAVARRCAASPAVFCYDLMNEPVVPGGKRQAGDWLGPPFAGKHFVQVITLDQAGRPRPEIARAWTARLAATVRKHDAKGLVTVGLVDWSLDRPGLTSGFVPEKVAGALDFLCVHLYPEKGKVDDALQTLQGFAAAGKPVLIEETFPLRCSMDDFADFVTRSRKHAAGWIGFYWGKPPEELRRSTRIADALMLQWLRFFQEHKPGGREKADSTGNDSPPAWKFAVDESFNVEHTTTQWMTLEAKNKPFTQKSTAVLKTHWKTRALADGEATVLVTVQSLASKATTGEGTAEIAGKDDAAWKDAEFVLRVDATGKIRSFEGYDRLLKKLAGGDAAKQKILRALRPPDALEGQLQQVLGPLPGKRLGPGETWLQPAVDNMTIFGAFRTATEWTPGDWKDGRRLFRGKVKTVYQGPRYAIENDVFRVLKGETSFDEGSAEFAFDVARGRTVRGDRHAQVRGELTLETFGMPQKVKFECRTREAFEVR